MDKLTDAYHRLVAWIGTALPQVVGKRGAHVFNVMKNSVQLFKNHDTFTLGAALSYYMVFSIAPMLIIVTSVVGMILGPDAITGEIKRQVVSFVGNNGANQLQDIIKAAYKPGENGIATIIATIVLIIGATGVFDQLRTSLNVIWDIKPQIKKPVAKFLANRFFSFAMIISLAFLLLISLVIHAALAGFNALLEKWLSDFSVTIYVFDQTRLIFFFPFFKIFVSSGLPKCEGCFVFPDYLLYFLPPINNMSKHLPKVHAVFRRLQKQNAHAMF